ncbi:response regulator transcription factor [Alteromonas sp. a30]|uniref:response regulator transcription factor n=1 Tax=Alteromonas sp. a30 TaxID=2730917 RepID=UPI002281C70A|nr:response regulator [Alteromonas sp. a30]MCY7295612.1 response regulator [Alteromonas sp. a30]
MSTNVLAILDDDRVLAETLSRRLAKREYEASTYFHIDELLCSSNAFTHIILDLNLGHYSVLSGLEQIRQKWPRARIIILTGYASIAGTVSAMKKGADDYLTKPINFEQLLKALKSEGELAETTSDDVISSAQLEWEHIQRVLLEHDGNISATARALNMHRRTLQRKLQKKPLW